MITAICIIFILGYAAIALEHPIKINKAATALITAALCWSVYALFAKDGHEAAEYLTGHLGEVSGILFFLMGAMTIVELIDAHDGFYIITSRIKTTNKKKLVWLIAFITFFLSAVLDNLTTTIVLVSLLRKIIADKEERLMFAALVVIAANAGGAWSPIGDVTTTMLWIGGQITAASIIVQTLTTQPGKYGNTCCINQLENERQSKAWLRVMQKRILILIPAILKETWYLVWALAVCYLYRYLKQLHTCLLIWAFCLVWV